MSEIVLQQGLIVWPSNLAYLCVWKFVPVGVENRKEVPVEIFQKLSWFLLADVTQQQLERCTTYMYFSHTNTLSCFCYILVSKKRTTCIYLQFGWKRELEFSKILKPKFWRFDLSVSNRRSHCWDQWLNCLEYMQMRHEISNAKTPSSWPMA